MTTHLALKYNFLTPFTDLNLVSSEDDFDLNLVEPKADELLNDRFITYSDLDPVFFSPDDPDLLRQWETLKTCTPPIRCEGHFHFEPFIEHEGNESNCTGHVELFTRPNYEGELLRVDSSVHQLYHTSNSQRMRSIRGRGDCCWLLFDRRFFSGDVEKLCGDFDQPLRLTNVGSLKRLTETLSQ